MNWGNSIAVIISLSAFAVIGILVMVFAIAVLEQRKFK